jgi:hypothetical protein
MIQINELELEPRELSIDELRKVTGGASDPLAGASPGADLELLQQLTAQTLEQQLALIQRNLTVGPARV